MERDLFPVPCLSLLWHADLVKYQGAVKPCQAGMMTGCMGSFHVLRANARLPLVGCIIVQLSKLACRNDPQ